MTTTQDTTGQVCEWCGEGPDDELGAVIDGAHTGCRWSEDNGAMATHLRRELDDRFPVTCQVKPGRITEQLATITDPAARAAEVTRRLRDLTRGNFYPEGLS